MARIKIVPDNDMNAEGEWINVPIDFPRGVAWREMEAQMKPYAPAGFHIVGAERGPRPALNMVKLRP